MMCKTCNNTRKVSSDAWEAPPAPCPDCTGRVPDVEATLRAEVARLRETMADAEANARQAAELAERRLSLMNQLGRTLDVSVRREDALQAEVARLTAEVERLNGREREAADIIVNDRDLKYSVEYRDESRAAWLAGCES